MSFVWAALILGFAGSLHCIGMCGPLISAVHTSRATGSVWWRRTVYHLGRILVYAILGAITGGVGKTFVALGFQRWVAIAAGVLMLFFILWPAGSKALKKGPLSAVGWLKSRFKILLEKKSLFAHFALGGLNGLLPCGLVYVALSASIALSDVWKGALFMALFGLGTTPALLMAGQLIHWISQKLRLRSYRAVQLVLVGISFIVILRGSNLGIPFLSPKLNTETHTMDCCHKPS